MDSGVEQGQELIADFVTEAVESLQECPEFLGQFRQDPSVSEPIDAAFRAIHSIKGCAGFLGLMPIKLFAHSLEHAMDDVRQRKLILTEDLQHAIVEGFDLLEAMLDQALEGNLGDELKSQETELLKRVANIATGCSQKLSLEDELLEEILELAHEISSASQAKAPHWAQRLRSAVSAYKFESGSGKTDGSDQVETPLPESFADLSFTCDDQDVTGRVLSVIEMFLAARRGEYNDETGQIFIQAVSKFAHWSESVGQDALTDALHSAQSDMEILINSPLDIDADLLSVVWDRLWPELVPLTGFDVEQISNGCSEGFVSDQEVSKKPVAETSSSQQKSRMVRVREEKLDDFLSDVSSLFLTCELFKDIHSRFAQTGQLKSLVDEMQQINRSLIDQTTKLQSSVAALQQVAIAGLFSKVPRMARTLASQLDKKVDVHLTGQETQIDKSLFEDLDAPLTHMVRNSLDHGIETPEERIARGVSATGNLWLNADVTKTHVIITLKDDGLGIDPQILRNKAVKMGIYSRAEADALSDREAVNLIFHAGLSTAEELSEVSGRGVGLDVVRNNLLQHQGEIYVESTLGQGTTFRLEIPLREAVIVVDGLLLEHAAESFIVPFEHIQEITELGPADLKSVQGRSLVATIRGITYAAVSLGKILGLESGKIFGRETVPVVLVGSKEGSICLVVDKIFGHRQVVINGLKEILQCNEKIAGVAQLGGGKMALVLSVADLVKSLH